MAKSSPRSVLLTRFSALGDVAIAVPVVYDACRANPSVNFLFLTRKLPARLFVNAPKNLHVIGVDTARLKSPSEIVRLLKLLRKQYRLDTMVDLHDVIRTQIMRTSARLLGMRVTHINKERAKKRRVTRRRHKILTPLATTADRYRDALCRAGLDVAPRFKSIFEETPAQSAAFQTLTPPKQAGEKWIGVAPFAAHEGKIYPLSLMREVVEGLASRSNHTIFLFGAGPKETAELAKWAAEITPDPTSRIINAAADPIGLQNELHLIAHLDTMLTMDSANMHLASLTHTPTVSIWGATHPCTGFLGGTDTPNEVIQKEMPCRPCSTYGNRPCHIAHTGILPCLNIPAREVLQRIENRL